MKANVVDCFMLMGTALSLRGDQGLPEMGRPLLQDVYATVVNISLTLTRIYVENPKTMEIKLTFLLNQHWFDPRLGPNDHTRKLAAKGKIWKPFITEIEGENYFPPNDMTQYWRGTEGHILYSEKMMIRTFCTTNYRKFPFDLQTCTIKLGSYRFPKEEVELIWNEIPIEFFTGDDLREFKLIDVDTYPDVEIRPSGNFSVLVAQIIIKRHFEHYIFCTIIPCLTIVLISYIIFWLNARHINIRYFLSGLNLSLLIYVYHESVCSTLTLPYMKALDIFVLICILFVLMTLLQNILIDIFVRKETNDEYGSRSFHKSPKLNYVGKYNLFDCIACVIYPILFVFVMLFYCIIFIE